MVEGKDITSPWDIYLNLYIKINIKDHTNKTESVISYEMCCLN